MTSLNLPSVELQCKSLHLLLFAGKYCWEREKTKRQKEELSRKTERWASNTVSVCGNNKKT